MAAAGSWQQLEGATLDGRIQLGRLLALDPASSVAAVFAGAAGTRPVYVRFLTVHASDGPVLERHLEAGFLDHPHLLKCHGAGSFELDADNFTYVALDPWEATLYKVLEPQALEPEGARVLGLELLDALEFLHSRNLVYCNLQPAAVVRAGARWKLADYSHMQVAGTGYAAETRRLLTIDPGTPPEAFEGIVSPAWDLWSLAVMLTAAISERPSGEMSRVPQDLPEPFASLALECFQAPPQERCGLERARELLNRPVTQPLLDIPVELRAAAGENRPTGAGAPDVRPPEERPKPRPVELPPLPQRERFADKPKERRWFRRKTIAGVAVAALAGSLFMAAMIRGSSPDQDAITPPRSIDPEQAERTETPVDAESIEIRNVLDRWVAAVRERDADSLAALYAPAVDRFYLLENVSREFVRRERQRDLQRAGTIRRYEIGDVQTLLQASGQAVVTFDRAWEFGRGPRRMGKTRTQLVLKKMDDAWLIVSERDLV
jgi:ketosteroid isomerase-like protein